MLEALYRFYRKLIGLPGAVATLGTMGLLSIWGTTMYAGDESMAFFRQPLFTAVCVVFMLQLILAVADRYPWQKKHIGWIITHAGLVMICIGHLATCHYGVTGTVDLVEGQATSAFEQQSRWRLVADLPALGRRVEIPMPLEELEGKGDQPLRIGPYELPSGDRLTIERYFPAFQVRTSVQPDPNPNAPPHPAFRLVLYEDDASRGTWIFAQDDGHGHEPLRIGDALTVKHLRLPDADTRRAFLDEAGIAAYGTIVHEAGGERVEVAEALEREVALGESGVFLRVLRQWDRLPALGDDLDAARQTAGPIVQVELRRDEVTERRWLAGGHSPGDGGELGVLLRYEPPAGAAGEQRRLPRSSIAWLAVADESEPPLVAVTDPSGRLAVEPYEEGRRRPLPWFGEHIGFAVTDYQRRAVQVQEPFNESPEAHRPALFVRIEHERGEDAGWVVWNRQGHQTELQGGSGEVKLAYGARRLALSHRQPWWQTSARLPWYEPPPPPFQIRLEDFVMQTHEGTDSPASFESFVHLSPGHRTYPVIGEHVVPPRRGGRSGRELARIELPETDGLRRGAVLKIGTPEAYYYGTVRKVEHAGAGGEGSPGAVHVRNLGREMPLQAGDEVPRGAVAQEVYHIYMNNPLTHEGFTFFQSSYDPETLERSIFEVSFDPGWKPVYLGYALTVLGLLFIVYLKPVIMRREAARRATAALAARQAEGGSL